MGKIKSIEKIAGYVDLSAFHKKMFQKFLPNFLGRWDTSAIEPLLINYVEEIDCLAKENHTDDYYVVIAKTIYVLKGDGTKELLREWHDEDYRHLSTEATESQKYLRFEYLLNGKNEW